MYTRFYGLTRSPFELTPDPSSVLTTERLNEAFATLYCGIRWRKGFIVLTGEVGTGKTLLVRCLMSALSSTDVEFAYLVNTQLSVNDFVQYLALDFGLDISGKSKAKILYELQMFLINRERNGLTSVLVVDEAHHLNREVLEEIRLLTNLETTERKLLQILLVGQPELDKTLDHPELRQLKQRIALRSRLEPLSPEEVKAYIERRLQAAGANGRGCALFPDPTVDAIYRYSWGIPRLINILCDNAFIAGYARHYEAIPSTTIEEIASDLRLEAMSPAYQLISIGRNSRR